MSLREYNFQVFSETSQNGGRSNKYYHDSGTAEGKNSGNSEFNSKKFWGFTRINYTKIFTLKNQLEGVDFLV